MIFVHACLWLDYNNLVLVTYMEEFQHQCSEVTFHIPRQHANTLLNSCALISYNYINIYKYYNAIHPALAQLSRWTEVQSRDGQAA